MLRRFLTLGALFQGFALVLPGTVLLAPKGTVPLLLAAALATFAGARLERRQVALRGRPLAVVVAGLLLWAAAASLWSLAPLAGLTLALRLIVVAAAGFWLVSAAAALQAQERHGAAGCLAAGFGLALAVLLAERWLGYPLNHWLHAIGLGPPVAPQLFNRGATYLAILAWPVTAFLWRSRIGGLRAGPLALAAPAGLLVLIWPLKSLAAVVSLIVGLSVFALARLPMRTLLSAALVLGVAGAPFATSMIDRERIGDFGLLSDTGRHRVYMWSFSGERILERPIAGWGFDASRSMPDLGVSPYKEEHDSVIPIHPHNAVLQLWLELGVVGAGLGLALPLILLARLQRLDAREQALGQAMLATILTIACVSYGLWQNHWVAALFASAACFLFSRDGERT